MSKDASPADLAEPSGARVARRISVVLPRVNVLKTEDFSWLCTLPSRAVGAVWAKFIRCLWDAEKLNPLQEEEEEEIDPDKAKSGTGEELKDEEDAETADALSEADPLVAAAELYRNALERVEQMAEVQDQLEQFLEGIEPRVLAITQMK